MFFITVLINGQVNNRVAVWSTELDEICESFIKDFDLFMGLALIIEPDPCMKYGGLR